LASVYLAYRSWDDATFAYLRDSQPESANRERPDDAVSLARSLDLREQRELRAGPTADELRHVEAALVQRPLSRILLRQVGIKADVDGNLRRADAALGLANALSRRDGLTQLWWIERSVQKKDLRAAVRHYHAAMSVHPELKKALLPVLARALVFPDVRAALTPYIMRQSAWVLDLLDPKVSHVDPSNAAKLVDSVPAAVRGPEYEDVVARLLSGLGEQGNFVDATRLAHRIIPSFDPAMTASLAVHDRNIDPRLGTLAWVLADTGRLLATPNERGGFDVDVEPLDQGAVAQRIVPITGGRNYTFRQSVRGNGAGGANFTWQARCLPSGDAFWSQRFTAPTQTRHDEFVIAVPVGCKGLRFFLAVRGPEGQQSSNSTFEGLELSPRLN
jgi:hypothetical protein